MRTCLESGRNPVRSTFGARPQAGPAILLALLVVGGSPLARATERLGASETLPSTLGQPVPASVQPATAQPVTITDVVAMSRSGLDDQVIINLIRQNGMASSLATAELISLRQHGISNAVISAMQSAAPPVLPASAPEVVRVYEAPRPPVVVHSYVAPRTYVVPRPYYYPSYHLDFGHRHGHGHGHGHHGHRGHHGSAAKTSFGFGISWR